jgi:AdoMet-dependent rRNA methyltransferase SPB1
VCSVHSDISSNLPSTKLGLDEPQADVPAESASVVVQPLSQDPDAALIQEVLALQSKQQSQKKREKRKANEKKARALQRMQLQMTAPMDIGMEQADAALNDGQEDLFNIGQTLRASSSKVQTIPFDPLSGAEDDGASSYGDSNSVSGHSIVSDLDEQLDAMYSDFKSRRAERDAKYRVREGRKQNKFREEAWSGISADIHSDTDSVEEEGGWDAVEAQKAKRDEDDVLSESDSEIVSVGFADSEHGSTSHQTPPQPVSSAARRWFAQDIFTDIMEGEELVADKPSCARVVRCSWAMRCLT